ncbi:carbohydrate esterase family 4 protein [Mycena rosella]|uniref:Carbohydrate esterase family 4 protein n=1 Tax=Mycena rosella TaxID=1033263 RepID=A0AAD7G722_MYCRO|nr:carbohydrate esterase family 4 protein [Mycena rosella]
MLEKTLAILLAAILVSANPLVDRAAPMAVVYEACTVNNTVALTFDDGPYLYMTYISDLLTQNNAKGTFFVNGNNYNCIYNDDVVASLRYTFLAGHQIASHTWSHPHLKSLNVTRITREFELVDSALESILGIHTDFLRPPYGEYNALVREIAYKESKKLIIWDFDSGDSVGEAYRQSETDYDAKIAQNPKTLLALNHETEEDTAHYLVAYVINALQTAGYKLVTVAECLGLEPYASNTGTFGTRDDTWACPRR